MKHSTRHDAEKTLLFIFLFIYCLVRKLISLLLRVGEKGEMRRLRHIVIMLKWSVSNVVN